MTDKDFYLDFENTFRGSREAIKARLSSYDSFLDVILDKHANPNLLDIGFGRGEWMQKCQEKGFQCMGIDTNKEMVQLARERGLKVEHIDAKSFVKTCNENSFDLISLFHIIEHINHNDLFILLLECRRILKPNGILLLETPNIDNLQVSTKTFYLDPTHITPINPDYINFLLEKCGFYSSKYFFINSEIDVKDSDTEKLINLYKGIGYDLLVIAMKSSNIDRHLFHENNIQWINDINTTIGTDQLIRRIDDQNSNRLKDMEEKFNRLKDLEEEFNRLKDLEEEFNRLKDMEEKFNRLKDMEQKLYKLDDIERKINSFYRIIWNVKLLYISQLIEDLRSTGLKKFFFKKFKSLLRKILYLNIKILKSCVNWILSRFWNRNRKYTSLITNKYSYHNDRFFFIYKFYPKAHSIYATLQKKFRNKKS